MPTPTFLDLPTRTAKPRASGITHVLDKGLSVDATRTFLLHVGELVDIAKIGWGIGYVDPRLSERVGAYRQAGTAVGLGGTLLEIAAAQGRAEELRTWALEIGVDAVEVSNGLGLLDRPAKRKLVERFSQDFLVSAEVGSKDAASPVVARMWADEMRADLDAGATWVVAEGRESGTVGIYDKDGAVRDDVVDYLVARVPVERIIFEAPNKAQQAWFVRAIGPDVNLGNIAPEEVLPLETLRLGLRADTASMVIGRGRGCLDGARQPRASAGAAR